VEASSKDTTEDVIAQLGLTEEIDRLRVMLTEWVARCNPEVRQLLEWQFQGKSKYFRPLTVMSCYRALSSGPIPTTLLRAAAAVEMFHNVSLIIDDILDESSQRRGKATLHCQFGLLPALMASGYIVADGYQTVVNDSFNITLLSELLKRLGAAECLQWRLRRQPLGVEDWRKIAGEDTGSMFEICACLGTHNEALRRFGHLLGVLYHGCDDVGDVKGLEALGGGGEEDLRDGILTLPASLAIRHPEIRALFCKQHPTPQELVAIAQAMKARLPEAEQYLDKVAEEAREEAQLYTTNPAPLLALIEHTRQLSRR
jgi:geranylgeranyl pyrophosphate synthase